MRTRSSIRNALGALSFLIAVGVLGYVVIEGASFFDALFMTVTTITTIGYGDIVPIANAARMLSVMEAITGMFYIAIVISRLVALYSSNTLTSSPPPPEN